MESCCGRHHRSIEHGRDAILIEAVKKHGNDWAQVASLGPGRTKEQCYNRWCKYVDPAIDQTGAPGKGPWKPEEDAMLIDAVKKLNERRQKWSPSIE
jgi:hypothetical protein